MLNEMLKELDSLNNKKLISGGKWDKKEYHIINKDLDKKETSFLYDILKKYGIKYQERKAENFFVIEFDYRKLELQKFYNCLQLNNYKNISIKNTYILIENHDSLNYDDLKNLFLQFTDENPNCKLQLNQYNKKKTGTVLYYKIVKL